MNWEENLQATCTLINFKTKWKVSSNLSKCLSCSPFFVEKRVRSFRIKIISLKSFVKVFRCRLDFHSEVRSKTRKVRRF